MQSVTLTHLTRNAELSAQKYIYIYTFGGQASPDVRQAHGSPCFAITSVVYSYLFDWKTPMFDKFSGEVTEDAVRHTNRG